MSCEKVGNDFETVHKMNPLVVKNMQNEMDEDEDDLLSCSLMLLKSDFDE
jgi:hypothetical protein